MRKLNRDCENLKDANYAKILLLYNRDCGEKKGQMSLDEAKGKLSVSDDDI